MKRKKTLVENLNSNSWTSSMVLYKKTGIPIRTISRLVKSINDNEPGLITSSNQGYKIESISLKKRFLSDLDNVKNYNDPNKRQKSLLEKVIFSKSPLLMFDLMNEYNISESTLKLDLLSIKEDLLRYNLKLILKNNTVKLDGKEKNIRKMMSNFIYEINKHNFLDLEMMKIYFPHLNLEYMKRSLSKLLNEYNRYLDDFAINDFLLHIAVSLIVSTENDNKSSKLSMNSNSPNYGTELKILKEFNKLIKDKKIGYLSEDDCVILSIYLKAKTGYLNIGDKKQLTQIIDEPIINLTKEIVYRIEQFFFIDLSESEYLLNFSLHINSVKFRAENKIDVRNPLTNEIKREIPYIFEIAIFTTEILENSFHCILSEDETAFIALHLSSMIESGNIYEEKFECLIVTPNFYNLDKDVVELVKSKFKNDLKIERLTSHFEKDLDYNSYDIIISTIGEVRSSLDNVVNISPFVSLTDKKNIEDYIIKLKSKRKYENSKNLFLNLISSDFFIVTKEMDYNVLLHQLSNNLINNNIVEENFKKSIMDREKSSSTNFGGYALPHSFRTNPAESKISIAISKEAIEWSNGKNVHSVFMLAIKREDMHYMQKIYEFIDIFATSDSFLNSLNSINSFKDFVIFIETFSS